MSLHTEGQTLYAVAIAKRDRNGQLTTWPRIFHIHADSSAQAEIHFRTLYPAYDGFVHLGASPCIGITMYDAKGRSLVAETNAVDFKIGLNEREQDAAWQSQKAARQ